MLIHADSRGTRSNMVGALLWKLLFFFTDDRHGRVSQNAEPREDRNRISDL